MCLKSQQLACGISPRCLPSESIPLQWLWEHPAAWEAQGVPGTPRELPAMSASDFLLIASQQSPTWKTVYANMSLEILSCGKYSRSYFLIQLPPVENTPRADAGQSGSMRWAFAKAAIPAVEPPGRRVMCSLSSSARAHWTVQQGSDFKKLTPQKIPKSPFSLHHCSNMEV